MVSLTGAELSVMDSLWLWLASTATIGCSSKSFVVFFCCSSASFSVDGIDVSANKSCSLVIDADASSTFSFSVPIHECEQAALQ